MTGVALIGAGVERLRRRVASQSPGAWAILSNGGALVGTAGATSSLGFVYWVVAAHGFGSDAVGLSSAAISAMNLLGLLGLLGLGTLLVSEFHKHPGQEGRLIATGLSVSGLAGCVLGLGFALVAPHVSRGFEPLGRGLLPVALFVAAVALSSTTYLLDAALVGLLLGHLQFLRNLSFAVLKLVLLMLAAKWAAGTTGLSILATWTAGNLLSLGCLTAIAVATGRWPASLRPRWGVLRDLKWSALEHHVLNLALQLPTFGLPVAVTILLGARENAYFYLAWQLAYFAFVGPNVLGNVLFAIGVKDPSALRRHLRFTLRLSAVGTACTVLVVLLAAGPVLSLFGKEYALMGSFSLKVLGCAVAPMIIKYHYVALGRIRGRVGRAALYAITGALFELTMASVGGELGGLTGFILAWALALTLEALALLPVVLREAVGLRDSRWPFSLSRARHP